MIKGRGFAVVNEEQTAVPIETGSVLYIPIGTWHGLRNADPKDPMDALLVTTPVKPDGLGDYFRFATWNRDIHHSTCPKRSSSSWSGNTAWRFRRKSESVSSGCQVSSISTKELRHGTGEQTTGDIASVVRNARRRTILGHSSTCACPRRTPWRIG